MNWGRESYLDAWTVQAVSCRHAQTRANNRRRLRVPCAQSSQRPVRLFRKDADFAAFEPVPLRILGYVVLGNHWHFVVWPRQRQDD